MSFWMREASLQIGSKKYSMDNLYFEFDVPFEDSDTIQTAKFKAYNLSESTRKGIKRGDVIILNAGYEGDVGAIFVGQVSACSHKHQNTEWITEISATAAMDQWLNSKVSKTYAKGSTAKEIVSDLLNIFGVEIGDFSLATNKVYDRGLVCNGKGTPYKAPQRGSTTDTPPRTVPSLSRERSPVGAPGTFSSTGDRRPMSEAPQPKMTPAAGAAKGASPRAAAASSSTENPPPVSGTPWPPTMAPGPSLLAAGTF